MSVGLELAIGTYGAEGSGVARATLIDGSVEILSQGGPERASFLAVDGDSLIAVRETETGAVVLLDHALNVQSTVALSGDSPCFVAVDREAALILTADYGSGTVSIVRAAAPGVLGETSSWALPTSTRTGNSHPRQQRSHAHQVVRTAWGTWLVSDLGGDVVHEFVVDPVTLEVTLLRRIELPLHAGPRHMVWIAPERIAIVGELDSRIHVFALGEGFLAPVSSCSTYSGPPSGPSQPSHIDISGDGRWLFVANRGRDTIGVFAVEDGDLRPAGEFPSGGVSPRHFAVVDDLLLVANQQSDEITTLRFDADAATATVVSSAPITAPAAVVPLHAR